MDLAHAARCLEKLGNPTRLAVFRLLVRAGEAGLAVGQLQAHLGVPASTLSHHVAQLVNVGLVTQAREGRVLRCRPDFAVMDALMAYLTEECCRGVAAPAPARDAG
ncbi:MAG: metalloregulator ArsR/SmtB family transcription factor [Kiloniellales bacterium]|nr:metalloregulator ArsR/SmtB family transcription factor [Kiloniellales bacterium]